VGGARAGVVATALSVLAVDLLFTWPRGNLLPVRLSDWVGLLLYAAIGLLVSWMADKVGWARRYEAEGLERDQAEQAVRGRGATVRCFYECAPLMMGIVEVPADNSDILHVYDNPATDRFFGRPRGSTAGQSAMGMGVPEEAVRRWIEHYR